MVFSPFSTFLTPLLRIAGRTSISISPPVVSALRASQCFGPAPRFSSAKTAQKKSQQRAQLSEDSPSLLLKPASPEVGEFLPNQSLMGKLVQDHIERYDHENREVMFSEKNPESVLPGSILQVELLGSKTSNSTNTFLAVLLGINQKGLGTTLLLRTMVTKVGVEMVIPLLSPMVRSIKVVRKAEKGEYKQTKLYYLSRLTNSRNIGEKKRGRRGKKNRAKIFERLETMKKI